MWVWRGAGRISAAFVEQNASKHKVIEEERSCHFAAQHAVAKPEAKQTALAAQQEEQARRKAKEDTLESEDEAEEAEVGVAPEQEAGQASENWFLNTSPAAYGMRLLRDGLPAPQLGGGHSIPTSMRR